MKESVISALSSEEIIANAMLFFLAGYENTTTTLAFALYCLAINPSKQERLREEIREYLLDYEVGNSAMGREYCIFRAHSPTTK